MFFVYPNLMEFQIEKGSKNSLNDSVESRSSESSASFSRKFEFGKQFHELPLEEQIKESTAIAIARFESSNDGRMKAIIKEYLKKKEGVKIYYDVGDEHPSSSFYPEKNTNRGEGVIIFFGGNPASMKMSMTYEGEKIRSLGDIPMSLFKEKCKEGNA